MRFPTCWHWLPKGSSSLASLLWPQKIYTAFACFAKFFRLLPPRPGLRFMAANGIVWRVGR
jgi:hypothetical protein